MPFVAYVHANDPDPDDQGRQPWEPNWRLWRWVLAAIFVSYGATRAEGALETLLIFAVFALVCRAALELLPEGDGMREYRQ